LTELTHRVCSALSNQDADAVYIHKNYQQLGSFGELDCSWHVTCSVLRRRVAKPSTEREKMETAVSSDSYATRFDKETFDAAVCIRCGAKMFPTELLEAHMDRHELKDMYLQSELKKLQYSMNRMR
jgi:hypothetical protein